MKPSDFSVVVFAMPGCVVGCSSGASPTVVFVCKELDAAVGIVDLDFSVLETVRKKMPIAEHRREELYCEDPFMQ